MTGGEIGLALLAYLQTAESYHINTRITTSDLEKQVRAQWLFQCSVFLNTNDSQMITMQNGRSQLNVLLTTGPPILEVLNQGSGSTATRNFMSWNKAYSIFPVPTFRPYKGYLVDPCQAPTGNSIYRLGWRVQDVLWLEERRQDRSLDE